MFKKTIHQWRVTHTLPSHPEQACIYFHKTLFGNPEIHFYHQNNSLKIKPSMLEANDWRKLIAICQHSSAVNLNEPDSMFIKKTLKKLSKAESEFEKHIDQAMHDDAMVELLFSDDEDTVNGCIIS